MVADAGTEGRAGYPFITRMTQMPAAPTVSSRHAIARELLATAPVFRGNRSITRALERPDGVDFERLLNLGHWCTGEFLVLQAAAAIAGATWDGDPVEIDEKELWYRLDSGNYAAVRDALARI